MYAFVYEDKAVGPDGIIKDVEGTSLEAKDAEAYNKALEAQEIENFKTGPEHIFAYIGHEPMTGDAAKIVGISAEHYCIKTWPGTFLGWAWIGPSKVFSVFGSLSRRCPVTVRIFGTLYHGWYFKSSGDYVRLKKAKRQYGNASRYAASLYVA